MGSVVLLGFRVRVSHIGFAVLFILDCAYALANLAALR